ncbi:MAG TPA: hypothetical protein VKQ29_03765 [Aliidongia sp.]|nr:hypothetical protein [Aliidongia sp.]
MMRILLLALTLVLPLAQARAADAIQELPLGQGRTPSLHDFSPPLKLERNVELSIVGENTSSQPVVVVLRVDDGQSSGYASRLGEERVVAPGPFRIRSLPGQWVTPSGRKIDITDIRRMVVFVGDGQPAVQLGKVSAEVAFTLPEGARGWKLGPGGGAVFPGFEPMVANDPRLTGKTQIAITRPSGDGLIGTGLRGIDRFEVPWPNGDWTVTLWSEDVGEWEYLPHELNRKIVVNGHTALDYHMTLAQWIHSVYFAGRDGEAIADGDPWALFGRRRGGLVSINVPVTDGRITIEQSGDGLEATFLSAVLVEPASDGYKALQAVQAARRERFLERWPVAGLDKGGPVPAGLSIGLLQPDGIARPGWRPPEVQAEVVPRRAVARGGLVSLDFMALTADEAKQATVTVHAATLGNRELFTEMRWGQWRYTRPDPSSTILEVTADHLRGDMEAMGLRAGLPRRINMLIQASEKAPPGIYKGSVTISANGRSSAQPFEIEVLPVTLAAARQGVGVYLEDPPYDDWFGVPDAARDRAASCDLNFMVRLGLTSVSPALVTPDADHLTRFANQMALVRDAGFTGPVLAYAPIKRLIAGVGIDGIGGPLSLLDKLLRQRGEPGPLWSIADEPGNPGSMPEDLEHIRRNLRGIMPGAKIAGHLNHKDDRKLLPLFDVALLNTGFGIDADELKDIRAKGTVPWLYNMPNMELAAGFFLWRSSASGYLQWHGRIPTADPFDPTDGREADVMLLPVTEQSCLAVPDIDDGLLRMARGLDDARWMAWLEGLAATDKNASALLEKIRRAVPGEWRGTDRPRVDLVALRSELVQFARNLR